MLSTVLTQLQNMILFVQEKDGFGVLFMMLSLILSALLSNFLFRDMDNRRRVIKKIIITYVIVVIVVFLISLGTVALIFKVKPQQDSFYNLFYKIIRVNGKDYLLPFLISFAAGLIVNWLASTIRKVKIVFGMVLGFFAIVSSIIFLLSAFQLVQRPNYHVPTETVASIVNSRFNVYPMALTKTDLENIEERNKPKSESSFGDSQGGDLNEGQELDMFQPTNFAEYVSAAIDVIDVDEDQYEVYLREAYRLFLAGRHDNHYFYIGAMWNLLAMDDWFNDIDNDTCLHNSIEAYKKCEESGDISQVLYTNMVIIYNLLNDIENIRSCFRKCFQLDENGEGVQSEYMRYVYQWMESEELNRLMEDAGEIIDYSIKHETKVPISMCVLYGACAADRNENIQEAYQYLVEADKQYEGKDPMVKILRCICADMHGIDETDFLPAIYDLEELVGELTDVEELYLIRYLHATGRYDELWGYIADVGAEMSDSDAAYEIENKGLTDSSDDMDGLSDINSSKDADAADLNEADEFEELEDADIEKAAIKAEWYFKKRSSEEYSEKGAEKLFKQISNRLQKGDLDKKDEKILQLSRMLLCSCIDSSDVLDAKTVAVDDLEEVADIAYVFLAVNAFNDEEYSQAISYCDNFFEAERNLKKRSAVPTGEFSLKELEAQEQVILHYHMQLIYAHSYFEYARTAKRGSEEWTANLKKARDICDEFKRSSKSLFYIGEQFDILRGSIESEKGEIEGDDKIIVEQE